MGLPRSLLQPLVLLALVALCFLPGLGGGFIFDDYPNIVDREAVHATTLEAGRIGQAAASLGNWTARPIPMATFAIDHAIAGLEPRQYKITNLVLHALNALLVLALLRLLMPPGQACSTWLASAALFIAMLWALHPLQVSTVHYVVQRMEIMAATFVLAALILYCQGRKRQVEGKKAWPWLASCLPLVALGYLCKESALLFFVFAFSLELAIFGFRAGDARIARGWRAVYALGVLLAIAALLPLWQRYASPEVFAIREFTAAERVMTQLRIVPMYLGWILYPDTSAYAFYYDNYVHSTGLLSPISTLFGAALLLALGCVAFLMRHRAPLFSLGTFWFLGSHAMTSSFLPLELVFEHRNYLSILGVALGVYGLASLAPARLQPRAVGAIRIALVAGLAVLTLIRSASWGDPLQLAMELVERNPGSSRASMDLGEQYMFRAGLDPTSRYYALAQAEYERGAAIPGSSPMPEQGLIVMAAASGVEAKPEWWDSVIRKLTTRAVGPQEMGMIAGLLARRHEGLPIDDRRLAEAYTAVIEHARPHPAQVFSFGLHALEKAGDQELASRLFLRAASESRDRPELVAAMVETLRNNGHEAQAIAISDYARTELGIMFELEGNDPPDGERDQTSR